MEYKVFDNGGVMCYRYRITKGISKWLVEQQSLDIRIFGKKIWNRDWRIVFNSEDSKECEDYLRDTLNDKYNEYGDRY